MANKPDVSPKFLWSDDEDNVVGPDNANPLEAYGEMQAEVAAKDIEKLRQRRQELRQQISQEINGFEGEAKEDLDKINSELETMDLDSDFIYADIKKLEELLAKIENLKQRTIKAVEAAEGKEKKETREQILEKLNQALEIIKKLPAEKQTDRISWIIKAVENARDRAVGSADLTFEVSSGSNSQAEGIPVDDMMEELSKIIKEQEEGKAAVEKTKKELALLKEKANQLRAKQEEILNSIGRDKPGEDQEHQPKIAWHGVYNSLATDDPLRQWVDGLRRSWAQADKAGDDYAIDSDQFALQTGEALKQAIDKIDASVAADTSQEKLDKLNSELENIKDVLDVLSRNSKNYFELRPDMQGEKQHWRTELEAKLIQLDIRSTGDMQKDYELAMEAMQKRRELTLAKDKATEQPPVVEQPIDISEPEWITQESTPIEPDYPYEAPDIIKKPEKKKAYLIDISEIAKAVAWREAEQKLRAFLAESSKIKEMFVRLGEKGYLMKFYKEALDAITSNKNLMAEIETRVLSRSEKKSEKQDKSYEVLDAVIDEYVSEVYEANEAGDLVCNDEVNLACGQLFVDYATGSMTREQFDKEVDTRVIQLLKSKGFKFTKEAGRTKEAAGLMYANNLHALAEGYKKQYTEKVKELGKEFGEDQLENIKKEMQAELQLDIQLGLKQKDLYETKPAPVLKWYEKVVDAMQNVPVLNKVIANPVAYGVIGGVAGAVVGKGAIRMAAGAGLLTVAGVAPWLTPLILGATPLILGAGFGGTFAFMRRSRDLQYDRGMDLRRATLGMETADGARRTAKIREFHYDLKKAEDLQASLEQLLAKDALTEDDRKIIAEIIARMEIEKEQSVDLIGVGGEEGEEHKTKLVAMKNLKIALKNVRDHFQVNDDELRQFIKESRDEFTGNIQENDKNFDKFKKKQAFKSGLIGAGFGLTFGALGQAAVHGSDSALGHLWHFLRGETGSTTSTIEHIAGTAASVEHLTLKGDAIIDAKGNIIQHIKVDPHTGQISPENLALLRSQGLEIAQHINPIKQEVSVAQHLQEGLAKHPRAGWHDEPGKQFSKFFNKLIEHEGKQQMFYLNKDASGNVSVDASKILDNLLKNVNGAVKEFGTNPDGSMDSKLAGLRDQLLEWNNKGELAKHLQVAIFPTEADAKAGVSFMTTEGVGGDGKINLGDAISKLFTGAKNLKDGNMPFRFGELRIVDNEGISHTLATVTGKDINPSIMAAIDVPHFDYDMTTLVENPVVTSEQVTEVTNWDVPPVLPFDPRRPLEATKQEKKKADEIKARKDAEKAQQKAKAKGGDTAEASAGKTIEPTPEGTPAKVKTEEPEKTAEQTPIEIVTAEGKFKSLSELLGSMDLRRTVSYENKKILKEWFANLPNSEIDELVKNKVNRRKLMTLMSITYDANDPRTIDKIGLGKLTEQMGSARTILVFDLKDLVKEKRSEAQQAVADILLLDKIEEAAKAAEAAAAPEAEAEPEIELDEDEDEEQEKAA